MIYVPTYWNGEGTYIAYIRDWRSWCKWIRDTLEPDTYTIEAFGLYFEKEEDATAFKIKFGL